MTQKPTMTRYYGLSNVNAAPMTRQEYNDYRGWQMPDNENGSDPGMLIEHFLGGASNHENHKWYISWVALDMFEHTYTPSKGKCTFSSALVLLKAGYKVARSGWNGKGMHVKLVPTTRELNEHLEIKNVAGTQDTWVPSVSDLLAEDWEIVE